jgi:tetraacyldisaccharide 4'-kinase
VGDVRSFVERVWFRDDGIARLARTVLAPSAALYAVASGVRNRLYGAGVLRSEPLALPAISVGNLSVGGTGKTPVAAWLTRELTRRGLRPAVVLRGYGDDEPEVHATLNPGAIVVANPDRVAGTAAAAARGADVVVLDDAFQHRRARRDVDLVLVSADRWPARVRTLPVGPFRETLGALRRASMVIVTRKAASVHAAEEVARAIAAAAPAVPLGRAHLAPDALVDARSGAQAAMTTLAGQPVLAVCGVGDPDAFATQLAGAGARVTLRAFPDHHPFSDGEIRALAAEASEMGGRAVCTLKDAVKLARRWPVDGPALSYVSQQVILEVGRDALDRLLDSALHARGPAAAAAG